MDLKNLFSFRPRDLEPEKNDKRPDSKALEGIDLLNQYDSLFALMPSIDEIHGRYSIDSLYRMYNEDDAIYQATQQRQSALESLSWNFTSENEKDSDLLYDNLSKHIPYIISQGFWAAMYGWKVLEVVWEKRNGMFWPKLVIDRENKDFSLTKTGKLIKRTIINNNHIVPEKYLVVRMNPSIQHPYGDGAYKRLFYPYLLRCNGWDYFSEYVKRYALPFLYGKSASKAMIDPITGKSPIETMLENLTKAQKGSVIVTGKDDEVSVIQNSMNATVLDIFHKRVEDRISRTILGQTLTTGEGSNGSYALGAIHLKVLGYLVQKDSRMIENSVNELIQNIAYLNRNEALAKAKFNIQDEESLEKDRADRDEVLSRTGVTFTKKYFTERYDLADEDFELREQSESNALSFKSKPKQSLKFEERKKFTPKQQRVEKLGDLAMKEIKSPINEDDLRTAIVGASNEQDLYDRLLTIYDEESPEFGETLTAALYQAEALGYLNQNG